MASARGSELPVPPNANVPGGREIARVWQGADGTVHYVLATDAWSDPAAWGIALVDLARHAARAYAQTTDVRESDALLRIKWGFDAEWGNPTDVPTGSVT